MSRAPWLKTHCELLGVVAVTVLLIAGLALVFLTAPISEIMMSLRNAEDTDTVRLVVYLDGSRVDSLYVGGDGTEGLILHVSPGTHTVGIGFAYDMEFDETLDYNWTTFVGFDGINHARLVIDRDGIGVDVTDALRNILFHRATPLEQAIRDPHVVIPSLTLAALLVLLVILIWNYLRKGEKVSST